MTFVTGWRQNESQPGLCNSYVDIRPTLCNLVKVVLAQKKLVSGTGRFLSCENTSFLRREGHQIRMAAIGRSFPLRRSWDSAVSQLFGAAAHSA